MIPYSLTVYAEQQLRKLPLAVQQRLIKKLKFYLATDHPLRFAIPLQGTSGKTYRFRVGDYRIIFDWVDRNGGHVLVVWVGLRPQAY